MNALNNECRSTRYQNANEQSNHAATRRIIRKEHFILAGGHRHITA